jgi:hypothetical protein
LVFLEHCCAIVNIPPTQCHLLSAFFPSSICQSSSLCWKT